MKNNIPQQSNGHSTDDESAVELKGVYEAIELYKIARNRLLDINRWGDFSGFLSASFELTDPSGHTILDRPPQEGDYFKIKIPAPEPIQEFDWVRVEKIEEVEDEQRQEICIRVRPSADPASSDQAVQHFFTDEATSSFVVVRDGNVVKAEVHGRNEQPNLEHAASVGDGIRNAVVSSGAMMGGSGIQWKKLIEGILRFRK